MTNEEKIELVRKAFIRYADHNPFRPKINFTVIHSNVGGWIHIEFIQNLDVLEMESVCKFIRDYYKPTKIANFLFLSPKLVISNNGLLTLILDGSTIEAQFGF